MPLSLKLRADASTALPEGGAQKTQHSRQIPAPMVWKLWLRPAREVNAARRRRRAIPRLYCDDCLTAAGLCRRGGDEVFGALTHTEARQREPAWTIA
jgi:hypothetical protein